MSAPGSLRPDTPARIVLAGFMGSGKTTVGRLVAAHLGWDFLDLDDEVVRRTGHSVAALFASSGEARFREEERLALAACLERSGVVIALGGGAVETPANRTLLKVPGTVVIYLAGNFDSLRRRCEAESQAAGGVVRPLMQDPAAARERYEQRLSLYSQMAVRELDACAHTAKALAGQIVQEFGSSISGK